VDTPTADARIETLEFKLAHLERAIQELSDVVYRQQQQLALADARHQQLLDRLAEQNAPGEPQAQFEIPPHY
jgi:SlyX protein